MNVWIRRVRKQGPCKYCEKPIETGEYQVVCQYFMKVGRERTWVKKMLFHPQCWIDRAVAELETRTITETRGRKRMVLSDENREKRRKILRRHASIMQRINMRMGEETVDYMKVGKLIDNLDALSVEVMPYGGVPESWN